MWSDRETYDDCLGFSRYVESLADICVEQEIAPFVLGVFGSWGSGKTSLMTMLQAVVDKRSTDDHKICTLWFNAWRYEGKDEIQSALIHSIIAKLKEDKTIVQDTGEVVKRLVNGASVLRLAKFITKTAVTLTPDIQGFIDCFRDESEKVAQTMLTFEEDFKKLLHAMKVSRVVVFIDDLDRCQGEKVVETFETIKLFLNVPECTFVLGVDDAKIRQALEERYRVRADADSKYAEDYLEKIVQLPFRIPQQRPADIAAYVAMLVLRHRLTPEGWQALLADRERLHLEIVSGRDDAFVQWASGHEALCKGGLAEAIQELAWVLPHVPVLAGGLKGNPRQLKRVLNILELRRRLAARNTLPVQPEILVKLVVLEYAWRTFWKNVAETTDPNTGTSQLLAEAITAAGGGEAKTADSAMLAEALSSPGLLEFLRSAPKLEADLNLSQYLFLAQTALSVRQGDVVRGSDEAVADFAERITSNDRIRSEAAARNVRNQDAVVVAAVVRRLASEVLRLQQEPTRLVRTLQGLGRICEKHPAHWPAAVDALKQIDPATNDAVAVAAAAVLKDAATTGVASAEALREAVLAKSKTARALSSKKGSRSTPN